MIDFQRFFVKIATRQYDVKMKYVLSALSASFSKFPLEATHVWSNKLPCVPYAQIPTCPNGPMTQEYMWPRFFPFLQPHDTLIIETGTSQTGILEGPYPMMQTFMQTIFGSIGWATGAAVGGFVAAKEASGTRPVNRNILITGDGSLQLTVQAWADILRHDLNPIIFLLNNSGYTVERMIHGMKESYNDIPDWNYAGLLQSFGPEFETKSYQVRSCKEWDDLLTGGKLREVKCTQLVEIFLDKEDAPAAMRNMGKAIDAFNAKK